MKRAEYGMMAKIVTAGERVAGFLHPGPDVPENVMMSQEESEGAEEQRARDPLQETGPIPAEYQRDPYESDAVSTAIYVPVPSEAPAAPMNTGLRHERMIWVSAVGVSWAVTAVAVLKLLNVL